MQFNRDVMTELMEKECIIILRNVIFDSFLFGTFPLIYSGEDAFNANRF